MTSMARFTTPETLPEGEDEGGGGAVDVRRHRAALRPREPDHDVPHGRRLAAAHRALARPARRRHRARPGVRHRRPVPGAVEAGAARRSASTSPSGCWPRPAPTPRSCTATPCASRCPTASRRRRHVRLRPAQLREPPAVLRRAGPGRPPGRAHRAARGRRAARTGCCGSATASTSARSCRSSAACCPTRPPTATSPARSPTSPSPTRCSASSADAGFVDVERRLLSVGIAQLVTATRRSATRDAPLVARTRRVDHDLDLLALAGRDGVLLERSPRRAGRAGRGPRGSRWPTAADVLAAIEADDEVGVPGTGRRLRRAPLPPRSVGASWSSPRWCGAGPTTAPAGSPPSARPTPRTVDPAALTGATAAPATAGPAQSPCDRCGRPAWWCELVARATKAMRDAGPGRAAQGGAGPRGARRGRRALRPGRRPRAACAAPTRAASCSTSTGSSAPAPSCSSVAAATSCAPSRWPAPRPAAATRPPTRASAAGPARLAHLPARAPDHHRHGVRHAAPVVLLPRLRGRAVGGRRGQRAAPRHPGRGAAVAAAAVDPRAGARRCTRRRR